MKILREMLVLALFFLFSFDARSVSTMQTRTDCQTTCGDLKIEYPFGISSDCVEDDRFLLRCDEKGQKAFLNSSNLQVLSISLQGEMDVLLDVIRTCSNLGGDINNEQPEDIEDGGFAFSGKNDITAVGCDMNVHWDYFTRGAGMESGSCYTRCSSSQQMDDSGSSDGCCKRSISSGAYGLSVHPSWSGPHESEYLRKLNPCENVFIVKAGYFIFSQKEDLKNLRNITQFPALLDWTMKGSCPEAENTSFCGENSSCINSYSERGFSYSCKCLKGFEGNPYVQDGCKDIDECKRSLHSCGKHETCKNVIGSFRCKKKTEWKTIILISVIGFLLFLIGVCCLMLKLKLWKRAKLRERWFEDNGGILLVQRLLDFGAQSSDTAIKIFSEKEIKTATKGYHETRILGAGGQGIVYKGVLSDSLEVAIKKSRVVDRSQVAQFINELVLLSQINHPNVVRLLGCCLETQVPLLVYELVSGGTLYDVLFGSSLPWSDRLRIAAQIADTLSFLHFSAPVPIVHRDVKPANILLDQGLSAKLSDFGASRLVPANSEQLTTLVRGTPGYLDPEYLHTSTLSEKSDVYSFGVVLMELVSGEKAQSCNRPHGQMHLASHLESALRENRLSEVMDQRVVNAENHGVIYQVALLAMRCTRLNGDERPDMRQVAAELQGKCNMSGVHLDPRLKLKKVTDISFR